MKRIALLAGLKAVLTLSAVAQRGGGLGGAFNWDEPAAPAPVSPSNNPQPPPSQPAATPAPEPAAAPADPAIIARLTELRRLRETRQTLTQAGIQPLASRAAAAERTQRYRNLVDRTLRQPFLSGVRPAPELVQRVTESKARWGSLAAAIRGGKPPESLTAAAIAALHLPDAAPAGDPVKVTGALWAKVSDEYFRQTLTVENLGADLARHVRTSPKMRELAAAMNEAERLLAAAGDNALLLRGVTWQLHCVWMLGVELQIKLLERQLTPDPQTAALDDFLRDMDAARGLRHRGFSLSREGGAPPPGDEPAVLVRAPEDGTIRATVAGAEASVDIAPAAANRLPQLAEELYHVHYLLRQVDEFESQEDATGRRMIEETKPGPEREARLREHLESHRERVALRLRDYEGRRTQVLHEMTEEANRVLGGGR